MMRKTLLIGFILCGMSLFVNGQNIPKLDYLIKNALVFDGSGNPAVKEDIGVKGHKIVYIGDSQKDKVKSRKTIDAKGMYLTPGFIDSHSHYGKWVKNKNAEKRVNIPCLSQGVTTIFMGSDGFGSYHIKRKFDAFERNGIGTNIALWVGFSSVRRAVLGRKDVTPTQEQVEKEKELVAQGMKEGALGLSTGLFYTPQTYSKTPEVVALAKVAKAYGGTYDTHMRSESKDLVDAVQETIDIGKEAGIPVHISHIKCLGPSAWGTSDKIIKMVNDARAQEINVKACQYPFLASHTSLSAMLVPPWAKSGGTKAMLRRFNNPDTLQKILKGLSIKLAIRGGDSRIMLSSSDPEFNGKYLHEVAAEWNMEPEKAAIKIFKKHPRIGANSFSMIESDVENYMKQPWVMTCSDGGSKSHPRTYSTFIKKITDYVMKKNVISMADAIHKATGETATFFGLKDRGFIKKGYYADIVLINPDKLKDNASYAHPQRLTTGVEYVFVNGEMAMKGGRSTGTLAGQPLKHNAQ